MGSQISIDKQFTNLDELTGPNSPTFKPCIVSASHSHHLKLWRFYEENGSIQSKPVNLTEPQSFKSKECYLVLLIYKRDSESKFVEYPHTMWAMLETLSNLTPRGLENIFTSDDSGILDTILLSKREIQENEMHYMLFVWNGRSAGALLKAFTLTKGFELDKTLVRGKSLMLQSLFMGVQIINKKPAQGETLTLDSAFKCDKNIAKRPDCPVFLLQWLWPENPAPSPASKPLFPRFKDAFLKSSEPATFVQVQEEKPIPKLNIVLKEKPDLKPKFSNLALSGLKTREQERVQLQNLSKNELDLLDENFDVRETNRKDLKLQYYSEIISELDPGLYVSSDIIARDFKKLKESGVTHVINCAANVCRNYYPEDFEYLHFFLKDSKNESIECVFYRCIEFINNAKKNGGKVLVHCMQGVSRSVTVCLAYIIFTHSRPFEQVFAEAKGVRGICSPNTGFQVQLIWWHKRLCESYESLPVNIRIFVIGSHSREQPHTIVPRLLTQPLYEDRNYLTLDCRGVFLIQTIGCTYLWIGSSIAQVNKDKYLEVAYKHLNSLITYEHASNNVVEVQDGQENEEFWNIWGYSDKNSGENELWDDWFVDLRHKVDEEPQELPKAVEEEKTELKPKLFVYPESAGLGVFEDDEMTETAFLCLCTEELCYKWVGEYCRVDEGEQNEYLSKVMNWYYGKEGVKVVDEEPGEESYDFLDYF